MNTIEIRTAQPADFPHIARLIARQNAVPESQCLISGDIYDGILLAMRQAADNSELCFVLACRDDRLLAALGCEFDQEIGRGWLWGPFVVEEGDDVRAALLARLIDLLPPAIHRLDFFVNVANERASRFYLAQGFTRSALHHVYVAPRPDQPLPLFEPAGPLPEEQAASLRALHDTLFPQTYYTGQDLLDQRDDDHRLFVCGAGQDVLGYVYAALDENGEGYIDFLGVREDARGRGLGKRLLLTALQWLFEDKKVREVALTVAGGATNARSLYEGVGFCTKHTGLSGRKDW